MNGFNIRQLKKGIKRILSGLLIAALLISAEFIAGDKFSAAAFSDTDGHWANEQIERLAAIGLVNGNSVGMFNPDSEINRAEFLALVNRLFGASATADVSQFKDISPDQWYYAEIAKAYQMGTTVGNGSGLMQPLNPVTREQAAIIISRVLCMPAGNNSALYAFSDRESIAPYARDAVAAMIIAGYMQGSNGEFSPARNLLRAEAVTILNNIIGDLYSHGGTYSGNCDGNLIITTPNVTVRDITVKGDVIIGDGVGRGEVYLENCEIGGRLVIRGGGENSIYLSNTKIAGETYIMNLNNDVHISATGGSVLGSVIANSGVSLSGDSYKSVFVGENMREGSTVDLSSCDYESLDVMSPGINIYLNGGSIGNVNFGTQSRDSALHVSNSARIGYLSIYAPNIRIDGSGRLDSVNIGALGAELSMNPGKVYVADSITARINGSIWSGRVTNPTGSNVKRNGAATDTGYEASIVQSSEWSTVTINQTTALALEATKGSRTRLAYWVKIFLPAPAGVTNSRAEAFSYKQDGEYVTKTDYFYVMQDGKQGILYYVPVIRNGASLNGTINDELYIAWDQSNYEKIYLNSNNIRLKALSAAQEQELINGYIEAVFYTYDGIKFSGTEAIKRLLSTENALGLDVGAFPALPDSDRQYISAALNAVRKDFVTKDAIQNKLYSEMLGKGSLYAINRAITVEQIKAIIENKNYANEIGIDISNSSKYIKLSNAGRMTVAKTLYTNRGNDFTDIADVRRILNESIDNIWIAENDLLVLINETKTQEELQKILENKTYALMIGIITDADPYKKLSAANKTAIAKDMLAGKIYSSLDTVRDRFDTNMANYSGEAASMAVSSIKLDKTSATMVIGEELTFVAMATLPDKTTTVNFGADWSVDNPTLATVTDDGMVTALAAGTVKVTVTAKSDSSKTASATIKIVDPIYPTSIKLISDTLELGEGQTAVLTATVEPKTTNVKLLWTSSDESVATVDQSGKITALKAGVTIIRAASPTQSPYAECKLTVISATPGITISKTDMIMGVGASYKLEAVVSPITAPNRNVLWKTDDPTVAIVASDGTVKALALGTVTITAVAAGDQTLTAQCHITVDANTIGVALNKRTLKISINEEQTLRATVSGDPNNLGVEWITTNSEVISLDANGRVRGLKAGTATVYAMSKADPEKFDECVVTVASTTLRLTLNQAKAITMIVGDTLTFAVAFNPATTENKAVTWTSLDPGIASVSASGVVTALNKGKVRIIAECDADPTQELYTDITITEIDLKAITLENPEHITLVLGERRTINPIYDPINATGLSDPSQPEFIKWGTSDTNKVTVLAQGTNQRSAVIEARGLTDPGVPAKPAVYENGLIKEAAVPAIPAEEIEIKVTSANGIGRSFFVKVVGPGSSVDFDIIKIDAETTTFQVGANVPALAVKFYEADGTTEVTSPLNRNILWQSYDESIVKIDVNTGKMTFLRAGTVIIQATSEAGMRQANIAITVVDIGVTSITFGSNVERGIMTLPLGQTLNAGASVTPANATNKTLSWDSLDESIATVDSNGNIKAVKTGYTTITASADVTTKLNPDGTIDHPTISNSFIVYVPENPVTSVSLSYNKALTGGKLVLYADSPVDEDAMAAITALISPYDATVGGQVTWSAAVVGGGTPADILDYSTVTNTVLMGSGMSQIQTAVLNITAKKPGEIMLTATAITPQSSMPKSMALQGGGYSYTYETVPAVTKTAGITIVVLPRAVTGVTLDKETMKLSMLPAENALTGQLTATVMPDNATNKNLIWSTSDAQVATVSSLGLVTALSDGNAVITVETEDGGFKKTCAVTVYADVIPLTLNLGNIPIAITAPVTVNAPEEEVEIKRQTATVVLNGTLALPADIPESVKDEVTWTSSDEKIATVTEDGVLKGIKAGKVTVTVEAGGKSSQCAVTVSASPRYAVKSVTMSKSTATLLQSKTLKLSASIKPSNASIKTVYWYSGDESIATVDQTGLVKAVGPGSTEIYAVTDDGAKTAKCKLTVTPQVTGVTLDKSEVTIKKSKTLKLNATVFPENAADKTLTWKSSATAIVTVDKTGKIKGIRAGTATITVTTKDGGFKAECVVTVTP